MKNLYDIAIIGGGVIGCAIARELSKYRFNTILIEKEPDVAEGISKANSGVIHAGFNVKSGTLKAKLNNEGVFELPKLADELGLEYRICKKLVVAKDDIEKEYLIKLIEQGQRNNTPGLSIIDGKTIKHLEPNVNPSLGSVGFSNAFRKNKTDTLSKNQKQKYLRYKWALYSEFTGIITPYLLTIALAENAFKNGVDILLNTKVHDINRNPDCSFTIKGVDGEICRSRWVINCAGINSDSIAGILETSPKKIYSCRGEYFIFDKNAERELNMAVYPVPPKDGSGLGVHLTPTLNGNILVGPSADYINDGHDLANSKTVMDILKKEAFELMPAMKKYSFIKNFSGMRPKLFNSENGQNTADFYIKESEKISKFVNLIGIESPGLTSTPAIAKYVIEDIVANKEDLLGNKRFDGSWTPVDRTANMSFDEISQLIKKDSNYGEMVCRCEQVSKGEIIRAINNPFGVKTLNGIKKRTHSMMGRCQSGFCLSRISKILIDEYNIAPDHVVKNRKESNIFF